MNKVTLINWLPCFMGLLLLVVIQIDLYQFSAQSIEIKAMLLRELPIVLIGFILSIIVFLIGIYWVVKKQWLIAAQSFISPVLFLVCFILGGVMGGAFLNAT